MRISVEQLDGERLVLAVTPEMTMREVKQQIKGMRRWEDEVSRNTTFLEVIVGDKKVRNDETVAEVGLSEGSKVSVILRQNVARCLYKGDFGPEIDPETLVIVDIPDSTIRIAECAFEDCRAVAQVTIPCSIRRIGSYAFADCSALRQVTIPNSVTQIGACAFTGCTLLASVILPDSLTQLDNCVFQGCASLTTVVIPHSVRRIGMYAFRSCSSLRSVTIPDSVTELGKCVFQGCSSLTSVAIPDSVMQIGSRAFEDCGSLRSVLLPDSQMTLTAPARLLHPDVGRGIKMVAKECGCCECDYSWFQNGWVCPKNAG